MQSDTAGLSASVFLPVLGSAALAAAIKYTYAYNTCILYTCIDIIYIYMRTTENTTVVLIHPRRFRLVEPSES